MDPQPESTTDLARVTLHELRGIAQQHTPARLFRGRVGGSNRTRDYLELRADHAAAVDAVQSQLDSPADFPNDWVERWRLWMGQTCATSRREFLLRPDLGRRLDSETVESMRTRCPAHCDLQVVLGDGLSLAAILRQGPAVVERLADACGKRGWSFGQPFAIRFCRVGVLNDIGEILDPSVVVLLIGERPGLATDESLSAYMAYRPRQGHTDAQRNLVSNIHARGVSADEAAERIIALADTMRQQATSGVQVKEHRGVVTRG